MLRIPRACPLCPSALGVPSANPNVVGSNPCNESLDEAWRPDNSTNGNDCQARQTIVTYKNGVPQYQAAYVPGKIRCTGQTTPQYTGTVTWDGSQNRWVPHITGFTTTYCCRCVPAEFAAPVSASVNRRGPAQQPQAKQGTICPAGWTFQYDSKGNSICCSANGSQCIPATVGTLGPYKPIKLTEFQEPSSFTAFGPSRAI